jgi:predicted regulator of amino acid metabolism with ACT domain
VLGRHGINIISAAVGRRDDEQPGEERNAVMAITTDSAVPGPVIEEIVAGEGFAAGHTVTL